MSDHPSHPSSHLPSSHPSSNPHFHNPHPNNHLNPNRNLNLNSPPDDVLSLDDSPSFPSSATNSLTLLSRDHHSFILSKIAAMSSELLRTMLEGDSEASEVQLRDIEGSVLQKICDYLSYHISIPPRIIERPIQSLNIGDLVDSWDADFVDLIDQEMLFKLLLAANYLNIRSLISLCCAKIATMIKSKSPEQIRTTFGIRHDATPQEEQEIAQKFQDLIG